MRALLIGGNGFIGSHLTDELINSGWDVVILDMNERRYDANPHEVHFIRGDYREGYVLREAIVNVDVVFHLAWSTIHEVSNQDPITDITANLVSSVQLLKSCIHIGVKRVVFCSSGGTVYGPPRDFPISEIHPTNPITSYGITKLAVEKYLHMYWHLHGLDYIVVRPSVPYGPRQNPLGRQGAVAVFLYRIANNLPITLWGDGQVTRDYFYISDLINALVKCAEHVNPQNRIFNIGGGQEVSLTQLIELIQLTTGKNATVEHYPFRKFDVQRMMLDTNLAKEELKWQPRVKLEEGLKLTWEWMSSHKS